MHVFVHSDKKVILYICVCGIDHPETDDFIVLLSTNTFRKSNMHM